jgi:tetratricopeptide (TPR) repeat protein
MENSRRSHPPSLAEIPAAAPTDLHNRAAAALQLFHAGDLDAALSQAQETLAAPGVPRPLAAEMHHLEAAVLHQLERREEAIRAVRAAIALEPANATYLNTYGVILRKLKRPEQAIRAYERVIELMPDFADVYYNCGNLLNELERKQEAIQRFERCLELNPSHASAHHNIANCMRDLKQVDLALRHYAQSAQLEHHNPDMHCNWGLAWQLQERWDKAIDAFQTAISQKSDHAPSHINLGSALAVQERFEEACSILRIGVQLDDNCNDAKFNLGLTLLTIGEFEEGWHFYDTRLRLPDKVRMPLPTPIWDGRIESLQGEPLLVWAEQGYGDNIQFARYVPILIDAGVQVTLSTRKPLIPLLRECLAPHSPAIVDHKPSELQGFKHHVPLLTLPRLCRTSVSLLRCTSALFGPPALTTRTCTPISLWPLSR